MITLKGKRILIISPHPDDEVFGCGGFIHRAKREGASVYILYITVGGTRDFSIKGVSSKDERLKELENVSKFLKFDGYKIAFPGDEYHLKLDTIPQKDLISEIENGKGVSLEAIKPDIVAMPGVCDYNQDHRAVYTATMTATRPVFPTFKTLQPVVLTYELAYFPWAIQNNYAHPTFAVALTKADLEAKMQALELYKSQLKVDKGPLSTHAAETLATLRGIQSGKEYAESFIVKRLIV